MANTWYETMTPAAQEAAADVAVFIPRILAAALIVLLGNSFAKALGGIVARLVSSLKDSRAIEKTPVEHFFKNEEMTTRLQEVASAIFYWLAMLVVFYTAVSVLGLTSLSVLFERILAYLPHVFSAFIVLIFGVLLAGLIESVVKNALRTFDGRSARLVGKISSYVVVTLTTMIAISELGIARQFILVLFIGFVAMLSLGLGLALGLGGQDLVRSTLSRWNDRMHEDSKE